MSLSHEDLLLLILSDQRWHSLHEILRRHPMMVHSRAAGLREKGYVIEHRCVGKGAAGSEYRLGSLIRRPESALSEAGGGAGESPGNLPLSDPVSLSAFEGRLLSSGEPAVDSPDESSLPLGALTEGEGRTMVSLSSAESAREPAGALQGTPSPSVSAPARPLVEPGETRDQEPTTAGSPGVSRTADAGAGQEGPLSPGSTSGPPWRDAGGCDSWGASRPPLPAAPDTVRLQESLPVPGQLSLGDAA